MVAGNANYQGDLLSTTFEEFMQETPIDVIFQKMALWEVLKGNDRVTKDGGERILEPLMISKSSAVGSYSGYDQLDITPQQGLTNAEYLWKQYYGTVTISGEEERKNQGSRAIIKILDARWTQARMSLADKLAGDIYLDGTGNGSKDLTGLALMVDSSGTYGNIVRSANTFWSSQETPVSGALALAGSTGMRRMYNDCSRGHSQEQPDLILTTQAGFEAYEGLSDTNIRYMVTGDGQVTYSNPNLMFKKAKLFWDDYCQSGTMYFLNTNYIKLVTMKDMAGPGYKGDFAVEPFVKPADQDAKTAKFLFMGQLVCSNCARQGKLTSVSNA